MNKPKSRSKFTDGERYRALSTLSKHVGRGKAIGMQNFFEQVFQHHPESKVNGTRKLRFLVTELRASGEPICSTTSGGYYIPSAGSELDDYCNRMTGQALQKLLLVSRLKKVSLQSLCTQLDLDLNTDIVSVRRCDESAE